MRHWEIITNAIFAFILDNECLLHILQNWYIGFEGGCVTQTVCRYCRLALYNSERLVVI